MEKSILEQLLQLFATGKSWLEQTALDQLAQIAALPHVVRAVAFPDLHAGKGVPLGVAVATKGFIYPHICGNDIGCGMALFATAIESRKFKLDRAVRRLEQFKVFEDIEVDGGLETALPRRQSAVLGSIGGGNHFAEITRMESEDQADGFDPDTLFILVHSGSRGWGDAILREIMNRHDISNGLPAGSPGADWYIERHDSATVWAAKNRAMIARRVLAGLELRDSTRLLIDLPHNFLESRTVGGDTLWLHRKGSAPSDRGLCLIPGSRGSYSYLVRPLRPDFDSLYSLAHGAGRKWKRIATKGKLGDKYTMESIYRNKFGGRLVCKDRGLLFEEAPEAYKNIEQVIEDLRSFGLVKVVARFKPLLTVKY